MSADGGVPPPQGDRRVFYDAPVNRLKTLLRRSLSGHLSLMLFPPQAGLWTVRGIERIQPAPINSVFPFLSQKTIQGSSLQDDATPNNIVDQEI